MSNPRLLQNWSKLYSKPTPAEEALEPAIASLGIRYRFQHPIWVMGIFPDFVLLDDRLVIEVDDRSHRAPKKAAADAERTERLGKLGWRVVRVSNEEALADPYEATDRLMEQAGLPHRTRRTSK